ncbi:hypothetical protein [Colwellia psychrerythraea]|uniref:Calcineurin-like phosphoesterase domain-containing protein n=1 Tax=Colwellia psychrerythraea TaxID=28229 RepID=A0A099KGM5_COLPS|nr:hypothetical protein [Colwellia psychrerythraea]KGJ89949.1 hypothetical protein GAB14E_3827 [Colwellia psychrerythraea]
MIFIINLWQKRCSYLVFLFFSTASSALCAQTIVILADTPYSDKEKTMLQGPNGNLYRLINEISPSVVMHLGDYKSGGKSCTNTLLKEHKALLTQIYPGRIIYTPGDNDWTDCDRASLAYSFDELERLEYLIKLMYQTSPLLTDNLKAITSQKAQVENTLWINDRLAISTIHLVGTSNGRVQIEKSQQKIALKKVDKRDDLNLIWLKKIEEEAKNFDALIIGFQADIYQKSVLESEACDNTPIKTCDAFTVYRQAFKDLAKRIKKPILISHGDTGAFCFEKLEDNLWHLNAAGDYRYLDATKVTFNKKSSDNPFIINALLNPDFPSIGCVN